MSFGTQQFQHRYFKDRVLKKKTIPKIQSNYILPILSTPQPHKKIPYFDYSPYSPYPPHPYGTHNEDYNDYLYNSLLIDTFKRDADLVRKTRKIPYLQGISHRRLFTEPITPYVSPSVVYVNNQNPEIITSLQNQNVMLASKIHEVQRKNSSLQIEATQQKQKVREYRRKYEKLKHRLKDQINVFQHKQAEQRYQRQLQLMNQQEKIKKIESSIEEVSNHLKENSHIFRENLRLRQQITRNTLDRPNLILFPNPKTDLGYSFDRSSLSQQEKSMLRLRREIGQIQRRLSHSLH